MAWEAMVQARRTNRRRTIGRYVAAGAVVASLALAASPADADGIVNPDAYDLPESGPLTVAAPGVRANDIIPADTIGMPAFYFPAMYDPFTNELIIPAYSVPGVPGFTYTLGATDGPADATVAMQNDGSFTFSRTGPLQDAEFAYAVYQECTSGDCSLVPPGKIKVDETIVTLTAPEIEPEAPGQDGGSDNDSSPDDGASDGESSDDSSPVGGTSDGGEPDGKATTGDVMGARTEANGAVRRLPITGGGSDLWALAGLGLGAAHLVLRRLRSAVDV